MAALFSFPQLNPSIAARQGAQAAWSPALALIAMMAVLPWLLPVHDDPWPTFHAEATMAAAVLVAAAGLLLRGGAAWRCGRTEAGLLALACVPVAQAVSGQLVYPAEAWTVAACIVGVAGAVLVGRRAQSWQPDALPQALFASLAAAALLSAGLAVYQWLDLSWLGLLVEPLGPERRLRANVGQPNNLSTLLAWGLVGLQWAFVSRRLHGVAAVAAALFVLFGIALTQSRTGWLQVAFLAVLALRWRAHLGHRRAVWIALGLAATFAVFVVVLAPLAHALSHEVTLNLHHQVDAGKRPSIWAMSLQAIALRPAFGYGWNQVVLAQVALADRFADLHVTVGHAHDVVLDLLLWNGLPIGVACCAAALMWWRAQLKAPRTPVQATLLAAVGVVALHALVELPHVYAFFFLPTGLMVGALAAMARPRAGLVLPKAAVGLLWLACAAWLALAWRDYARIEEGLLSWRLHESSIGMGEPAAVPRPLVLGALQQALEDQRVKPVPGMSAAALDRMRANVSRYPTVGHLFRYAKARALNGDPAEAAWAVTRLCALHLVDECRAARRDWCAAAAATPAYRAVAWPRIADGPTPAEHDPNTGRPDECTDG
ncbi:MAG: Wzy polymerase domain-containing protein [Rubrivivax sp.]